MDYGMASVSQTKTPAQHIFIVIITMSSILQSHRLVPIPLPQCSGYNSRGQSPSAFGLLVLTTCNCWFSVVIRCYCFGWRVCWNQIVFLLVLLVCFSQQHSGHSFFSMFYAFLLKFLLFRCSLLPFVFCISQMNMYDVKDISVNKRVFIQSIFFLVQEQCAMLLDTFSQLQGNTCAVNTE